MKYILSQLDKQNIKKGEFQNSKWFIKGKRAGGIEKMRCAVIT